jgi:hypothetical protein
MKKIFNAIRALKPQMYLPHSLRALQTALWCFERTNRGHSHHIDLLARASTQGSSDTRTPGFSTRSMRLSESTWFLMNALRFPREEWPNSPEFRTLWTLRDETGLIAMLTRENLLRYTLGGRGEESRFRIARLAIGSLSDGCFELTATIELRGEALSATRTLHIPTTGFDSLEGSWRLLRDSKRALKQLCSTLETAPEFADARIEEQRRQRTRYHLRQAMQAMSGADRAWALQHWDELRSSIPR